jgi:hypothetical protein
VNTAFSAGNVFTTGFRVWFRNLVPFLLITAMFYALPWIWAGALAHATPTPENLHAAVQSLTIATWLTLPINVFVSAVLTYGSVMELHGQRAPIGACIATGLSRFLPALAVGALTWMCICAAFFAFFIPGLIVLCMLYVTTQVAVLERPGLFGALSRSSALTSGHRVHIFLVILLMLALNLGSAYVLRPLVVTSSPVDLEAVFGNVSRLVYFHFLHQVVFGSLNAVMASVAYYFLRAEKEGTSVAELAAIFD